MTNSHATLGTLLRTLIDQLDSAVAASYSQAGLNYIPRFTPIVRALSLHGPMRIKDIAHGMGVSHSAVSQTVSALARAKWVKLEYGQDNRERIVSLTRYGEGELPTLQAHWANTAAAAASLNKDIGVHLEDVLRKALGALQERSFSDRIKDAASAKRR